MEQRWKWHQAGYLEYPDGKATATGYAGMGEGKNNPALEAVANIGPLPRGLYTITGPPCIHPHCGQFTLRLEPDSTNEMHGRAGFLLHGDNATGTASQGCIVLPRKVREEIWASGIRRLEVV
ncbi:Protein of unknown function DUF2778 [uncultured Caudovirales phage]|uniref:Tlde1 domain-containing protein n=1 Tax=uncultured Caudovirales phage TaxID=2100421 RepID=A0A6J5L8U4_9CAUD|nr:Protein of unknown function DUF2778 [uncultured Caudovirales phage]